MVDYIADYLENIRDRRVLPNVQPGYMRKLIPDSTPLEGESWDTIFADIEKIIMPGITHWQSPHMHAYFPALNSPPSLLGDMLADAINCLGFTWVSLNSIEEGHKSQKKCHTCPLGLLSCLYGTGDDRNELAGEDDRPAR